MPLISPSGKNIPLIGTLFIASNREELKQIGGKVALEASLSEWIPLKNCTSESPRKLLARKRRTAQVADGGKCKDKTQYKVRIYKDRFPFKEQLAECKKSVECTDEVRDCRLLSVDARVYKYIGKSKEKNAWLLKKELIPVICECT